jgi:NMD protein affecting ribosome stability and mRNA decay
MYGYKYDLVKNDFHSDLLSVYQYNERYTTNLKSRIKLRFSTRMPEFKIGDIVIYNNKYKFNKGKKYIVTYINIRINFNEVTFDCEISGWEDVVIMK